MSKPPNILWYCTDQQRWDTIRALGNSHIRTPTLDRLTASGVAFRRAYTQSPICTPSRTTFLTGRYPATHHVHRNGNEHFPPSEVLVTRMLADQGYDCGLVGKLHLAGAQGRVEPRTDDGYRYYRWSHSPKPDWGRENAYTEWLESEKGVDARELFRELRSKHYGAGVPEELHQATWCTEEAIRFISQKRDGPWLLSVNPFDPHPAFVPPEEYLRRYDPESLPYPLFEERDLERQRAFRGVDQQTVEAFDPYSFVRSGAGNGPGRGETETGMRPPAAYDPRLVRACYYAQIELVDHQLGRIIDHLVESGQYENTIVVFMSDHGELLGDHGLIYKGCRFFESLVHVPLIISAPGLYAGGRESSALVELVDLAPTLLEASGNRVPWFMQGRSLHPLLVGTADLHTHKSHVVCEYNDALRLPNATHATMCFDGRYKSVVYHNAHHSAHADARSDVRSAHGSDAPADRQGLGEIYDLQDDPGEFDNLWADPGHRDLREELLLRHFSAVMQTTSAGVFRVGDY